MTTHVHKQTKQYLITIQIKNQSCLKLIPSRFFLCLSMKMW